MIEDPTVAEAIMELAKQVKWVGNSILVAAVIVALLAGPSGNSSAISDASEKMSKSIESLARCDR